jgi:hypothetical protein
VTLAKSLMARLRARGVDVFVIPDPAALILGTMFAGDDGQPHITVSRPVNHPMFLYVLLHEQGHYLHSLVLAGKPWRPHYVQQEYFAEKFACLAARRLSAPHWRAYRRASRTFMARLIAEHIAHVEPMYLRYGVAPIRWAGLTPQCLGYSDSGERFGSITDLEAA